MHTKENKRKMLWSKSTTELFKFSTFKFCLIVAICGFKINFLQTLFGPIFPSQNKTDICLDTVSAAMTL